MLRGELLWDVASGANAVVLGPEIAEGVPSGAIEPTFVKQFNRALGSLRRRKVIDVVKRPATDLDEALSAHAFQTTRVEIRELRQRLLPRLPRGPARFSTLQNEQYIVDRAYELDAALARGLAAEWRALEIEIRRLIGSRPSDENLFALAVRGRELFHARTDSHVDWTRHFGARVTCAASFRTLASTVDLDAHLRGSLDTFVGRALPAEDVKRQSIKSALASSCDFHNHGVSALKQATKRALMSADPELVCSLPGHKQPSNFDFALGRECYSPLLDRLVDRSALRKLEMVRVVKPAVPLR